MTTRRARRRAGSLPRVPLPRQVGGAHEDKTRRPPRKQKHRKRLNPDEG